MRAVGSFLLIGSVLAFGCRSAISTKAVDLGKRGDIEWPDASPLHVDKGKEAKHTLHIKRMDFTGDVKLEFDTSDAPGIKIGQAIVPAGQESVEVTIQAAPDSKGGLIEISWKREGFEAVPGARLMVTVR